MQHSVHTLIVDTLLSLTSGLGIAQLVECRTRDRTFADSTPRGSGGRIFSFGLNFLLPHRHVKDPGHSAKNTQVATRLHSNTHIPFDPTKLE